MNDKYGYAKESDGTFYFEVFADYRDMLDGKTATKILKQKNPFEYFHDILLFEWYNESDAEIWHNIYNEIEASLRNIGINPQMATDAEFDLWDFLSVCVVINLPYKHYLEQRFCVNIKVDTGDGNEDFTLNSVFPSYNEDAGYRLNDKASIVWLAKQQGYTKTQLWKTLQANDQDNSKGFLNSMCIEVANEASHMNALTFLVSMSFRELIKLYTEIHKYENAEEKSTFSRHAILISKGTTTGLYDCWSGGGSMFEIELEKDIKLPIKYIRSALPDGEDGNYSIKSVYGMSEKNWCEC